MGSLFSKKTSGDRINLVFDIGSASVGGALVLSREGESPSVLFTTRHHIPLSQNSDFKRLERGVLEALSFAARDIIREGLPHLMLLREGAKKISEILCVYASPWYVSETKVFSVKRDRPFVLSSELIQKLVAEEEKGKPISDKFPSETLYFIERQILDIRLGGYRISNPLGKKITEAEITVGRTMIPRSLQNGVEKVLSLYYTPLDFLHHSFALASAHVVRDFPNAPKDFLFVDVGGEVTDVVFIKDGRMLETVSFPKGKYTVARDLAGALHIGPEEALSLLRLSLEGKAGFAEPLSFGSASAEAENTWAEAFSKALESLSTEIALPHSIYFVADDDLSSFFMHAIQSKSVRKDMLASQTFTIERLSGAHFQGMVRIRAGIHTDPFLLLETVYLHTVSSLV